MPVVVCAALEEPSRQRDFRLSLRITAVDERDGRHQIASMSGINPPGRKLGNEA